MGSGSYANPYIHPTELNLHQTLSFFYAVITKPNKFYSRKSKTETVMHKDGPRSRRNAGEEPS